MTVPRALERVGGLQAQYAPSMYIGLWSRLEGFRREDLTRALERRAVVQGTLMRATIHLVSARDYWPLTVAIRERRREAWLSVARRRPLGKKMPAAASMLRRRLADGPLPAAEVDKLIGKERARGVNVWLDLLRVPPSGTWERRRADLFADAEQWLGPLEVGPRVDAKAALELLVRRYLGAFGPSSRREIADWAGLPASDVAGALERMQLRRFEAEDGEPLFDLPRAPLPEPDTPAPVRFLPVSDATLLVHARRARVVAEEHRSRVFNPRTPHSVHTFLVDGTVAGTWKFDRGRVALESFGRLDRATRQALAEQGERLTAFHR